MDLIDRQAAIDIADDLRACISVDGYWAWTERLMRLPSAQPEMLACGEGKLIAQPEPKWIPCSERLPDIDEDGYTDKVLVSFDHYSGVEICEYRITDGVGRWYAGDTDDSPEDIDLQVTAWMPLPEPYTEE